MWKPQQSIGKPSQQTSIPPQAHLTYHIWRCPHLPHCPSLHVSPPYLSPPAPTTSIFQSTQGTGLKRSRQWKAGHVSLCHCNAWQPHHGSGDTLPLGVNGCFLAKLRRGTTVMGKYEISAGTCTLYCVCGSAPDQLTLIRLASSLTQGDPAVCGCCPDRELPDRLGLLAKVTKERATQPGAGRLQVAGPLMCCRCDTAVCPLALEPRARAPGHNGCCCTQQRCLTSL